MPREPQFTRPVFPSPATARMERAAASAFPRASHPAGQEPDNARRGGDRPTEHGPETTLYDIDRTSNVACLLNTCDIASHRRNQGPRGGVQYHCDAYVASPRGAGSASPLRQRGPFGTGRIRQPGIRLASSNRDSLGCRPPGHRLRERGRPLTKLLASSRLEEDNLAIRFGVRPHAEFEFERDRESGEMTGWVIRTRRPVGGGLGVWAGTR
jgi:hypothetical protein